MKTYGLLGEQLSHSYSPLLHSLLGTYPYSLYGISPEQLGAFLQNSDFSGLNVTIPYKKAVLPYCAAYSPGVAAIGAANTLLRRQDGTLYAENTDTDGFDALLHALAYDPKGKKAVIFGSGGAAAAVRYVLNLRGADPIITVSRHGNDNYENLALHYDASLLVNATPVGMYPDNGKQIADLAPFSRCEAVIDLIYNPMKTALLQQAEALGLPCIGGLRMLCAQAVRSSELFTGKPLPETATDDACKALQAQMRNIILIGMPGCGKSTIGRLLAEALHRPFFDADEVLSAKVGMKAADYLSRYGEAAFRTAETEVLRALAAKSGIVLATGGGCVTKNENKAILRQNGLVLMINRALSTLETNGRPLSTSCGVEALYEQRKSLYAAFSDGSLSNDGTPERTVQAVLELLSAM